VFTKGRTERGIAFPTSIAVNEIISNYSPLNDDNSEEAVLKVGDLFKVWVLDTWELN
jgi:methionine aminopeptidase